LVVKMGSGSGVALGVGVGVRVGVMEGVDVWVCEGVIEGVEELVGARVGIAVCEEMIVGAYRVDVSVGFSTEGAKSPAQAARRLVDRKKAKWMKGKRG
jgi:hypothetical protein